MAAVLADSLVVDKSIARVAGVLWCRLSRTIIGSLQKIQVQLQKQKRQRSYKFKRARYLLKISNLGFRRVNKLSCVEAHHVPQDHGGYHGGNIYHKQ